MRFNLSFQAFTIDEKNQQKGTAAAAPKGMSIGPVLRQNAPGSTLFTGVLISRYTGYTESNPNLWHVRTHWLQVAILHHIMTPSQANKSHSEMSRDQIDLR